MKSEPQRAGRAPMVQRMAPGTYAWCSCGRSARQPFCDGSHGDSGFAPLLYEVKTEATVAWCTCKRTASGAVCDGSHRKLQ